MEFHMGSNDYCSFLQSAELHRWGSHGWSQQLIGLSPSLPAESGAGAIPHVLVQEMDEDNSDARNADAQAEEHDEDGDVVMTDVCPTPSPATEQKVEKRLVDITAYLSTPQSQAAAQLGIPVSTLSKRWKEAGKSRMWPYRNVIKIDAQIKQLLDAVPDSDVEAGKLPAEAEERLTALLKERAMNLQPVSIRM